MAKTFYVPVDGESKEVKQFYVPVDGESKKVIKAYCSVDGVSKLFFGAGGEYDGFWFHYATNQSKIIDGKRNQVAVEVDRYFQTTGISFYFILYLNGETLVVTLSTDSYCGGFSADYEGSSHYWMTQYNYTINNDRWFYAIGSPLVYSGEPSFPNDFSPNCKVPNTIWEQTDDIHDIVRKRILPKLIYANDFAENYQPSQYYTLNVCNLEKALRKALGIFLFKNVGKISDRVSYQNLLSNIETIVGHVNNDKGNYNAAVIVITSYKQSNVYGIEITVDYFNFAEASTLLQAYYDNYGYDSFTLGTRNVEYETKIRLSDNGNINHSYSAYSGTKTLFIGEFINSSNDGGLYIWSSNVGMKF